MREERFQFIVRIQRKHYNSFSGGVWCCGMWENSDSGLGLVLTATRALHVLCSRHPAVCIPTSPPVLWAESWRCLELTPTVLGWRERKTLNKWAASSSQGQHREANKNSHYTTHLWTIYSCQLTKCVSLDCRCLWTEGVGQPRKSPCRGRENTQSRNKAPKVRIKLKAILTTPPPSPSPTPSQTSNTETDYSNSNSIHLSLQMNDMSGT